MDQGMERKYCVCLVWVRLWDSYGVWGIWEEEKAFWDAGVWNLNLASLYVLWNVKNEIIFCLFWCTFSSPRLNCLGPWNMGLPLDLFAYLMSVSCMRAGILSLLFKCMICPSIVSYFCCKFEILLCKFSDNEDKGKKKTWWVVAFLLSDKILQWPFAGETFSSMVRRLYTVDP